MGEVWEAEHVNSSTARADLCTPRSPIPCVEAVPPLTCSEAASSNFFNPVVCPFPQVCREVDPPNYGFTKFDNIVWAWLTILHITSLSDWSDVMYRLWGSPHVWPSAATASPSSSS